MPPSPGRTFHCRSKLSPVYTSQRPYLQSCQHRLEISANANFSIPSSDIPGSSWSTLRRIWSIHRSSWICKPHRDDLKIRAQKRILKEGEKFMSEGQENINRLQKTNCQQRGNANWKLGWFFNYPYICGPGGVAEWSIAAVLKTVVP